MTKQEFRAKYDEFFQEMGELTNVDTSTLTEEEAQEITQKIHDKTVDMVNLFFEVISDAINPTCRSMEPWWAYVMEVYSKSLIERMTVPNRIYLGTLHTLLDKAPRTEMAIPVKKENE